MPNDLALLETEFRPLIPHLAQALAGRMPPERLVRTVLVSCERTPKLLHCTRQSIFNGAMTFAILALEVDGVTGQGYLLPFKGFAQPVIGYRGYNTLGARGGLTITGEVVREGDDFDYQLGTGAYVRHKPKLGNAGRIIAAWAAAESRERPAVVSVLGLGDLEAVRARSPAGDRKESPWNDPLVGLPAMYSKTAKRRLSRSTPLAMMQPEFHLAAVMEEAFEERGRISYIDGNRDIKMAEIESPIADRRSEDETPTASELTGPAPDREMEELKATLLEAAEGGTAPLMAAWKRLTPRQQHVLEQWKDKIAKPAAKKVDDEFGGAL